jgi:thioester reductase-like protein
MNHPLLSGHLKPVLNQRDSQAYTLLTGATGLVGQFLLKELLLAGVRVAVLVRGSKRQSPRDRIETIMQRWERELRINLPRPIVIHGEVSMPELGMSAEDQGWVASHCESVIHNAAVVSFEEMDRTKEPWTTNVQGTKNVVAFLEKQGIHELHYVSTAYVCGNRQGIIRESELECGQVFRNPYEESKFLAEKFVREQSTKIRTTIYRPSIIAGDSMTGFASSYHGLMLYLRLLDLLVPQQPKNADGQYETPIELPVRGDEPHDIVTVNFVARGIASLFCNPETHGDTYHLCADEPTTFRFVIDCCCRIFNSGGVTYNSERTAIEPTSQFAQLFLEQSRVYQDYNRCETRFDMSNFRRYLPDFRSAPIDEKMIQRYLEFGRLDRWGKRRPARPEMPADVDSFLKDFVVSQLHKLEDSKSTMIGVELLGPGGGQWTAVIADGEVQDWKTGTSTTVAELFRLKDLNEAIRRPTSFAK